MAAIEYNADLDITGNVIVTGNVDGRDIAADGTKLDGIEASADVTDGANVSAAGAPIISSGSGAPSSTPSKVGDIYIDVTGDEAYIAVGSASSADWQLSNDGAGSGSTNLSWVAATSTVSSSNGDDATLSLVDGSNPGLMSVADKTKLNGIETNADVTDTANVDAAGAVMETDTSTAGMSFVIDEDNMATNTATQVPTQQSVKAYVDAASTAANSYTDGEITALQGSASGLYDTLGEIQAFIESNDVEIANLVSAKTDKYTENIGDGVSQSFAVTHSLATSDVITQVIRNSDNKVIFTEVTVTNANTVTIDTNSVPATDEFRVVVIG